LWGWGDEDEDFGYSRGHAVFEGYGGVEEEGCGRGRGGGGFGVKGWGGRYCDACGLWWIDGVVEW